MQMQIPLRKFTFKKECKTLDVFFFKQYRNQLASYQNEIKNHYNNSLLEVYVRWWRRICFMVVTGETSKIRKSLFCWRKGVERISGKYESEEQRRSSSYSIMPLSMLQESGQSHQRGHTIKVRSEPQCWRTRQKRRAADRSKNL